MRQIVVTILLTFGMLGSASAQKFLDRLQSSRQGEGKVSVIQSKAIDELVNGKPAKATDADATAKPAKDKHATDTRQGAATAAHKPDSGNTAGDRRQTDGGESAAAHEPAVDTSKKVMRNSYKVTGYRVQVFAGGNSRADKQKAGSIGARLKTHFPNQPVYVHFYSPRWICRMGNFRSYQEAEKVMKEVKALGYSGACVVKGKITVQY